MSGWKRQRHPDDVPTPVAVALADFCRRARAPASPALVREALSVLGPTDDAAVRRLTDAEPAATPLGPFAVVEVVRGTAPKVAAERQAAGQYELARLALEDAEAPDDAPLAKPTRTSAPPATRAPAGAAANEKRPRRGRATMNDRIAPRKRVAGGDAPRPRPHQPLPGTAFLPKRKLPAPRGRFTRVDSSRSTYEALLKADAKEALTTIVGQSATRFHVFRALEPGYLGRAGKPLSVADVEGALTRHQLFQGLKTRERDGVLTALATARGSAPLAAKELGRRPGEVDSLVNELSLSRQAGEIRERFAREALDPANLPLRLQLLFRERYLADLKIERRFSDALTRDVTKLLDDCAEAAKTVPELVAMAAKKHALVEELLARAVERLGLARRYLR
ncbi:MAG: hypothetical protein INH41_21025 [Myxococcaceae bacterium]|nr:hypothetical protein [Myxococcaceae bacterium]